MMPLNLFRLQLMETFVNLKHTLIRVSISILLALPFIFVDMPAGVKSSGLTMVILFTTFFGSAIPHSQLCEDGRFSRLIVLPISKPTLWLDLILSSAVSRILSTLILLSGFIIFNIPAISVASLIHSTTLLCGSIILLVVLGMLTGHLAGSNGQVHLFSALICGVIAFISGVIPAVKRLSWLTNITAWNPLHQFQASLITMINGNTTVSNLQVILSSVVLGFMTVLIAQRWISGTKFHSIINH